MLPVAGRVKNIRKIGGKLEVLEVFKAYTLLIMRVVNSQYSGVVRLWMMPSSRILGG